MFDNTQAESFFSRFKTELMQGGVFEYLEQARSEIFSYLEGFYKRIRLHSSLGYKSLLEFEMELKSKNGRKIDSFCLQKIDHLPGWAAFKFCLIIIFPVMIINLN